MQQAVEYKFPDVSHKDLVNELYYDRESGYFFKAKPTLSGKTVYQRYGSNKPDHSGYLWIKYKGGNFFAHRFAWFYVHGEWPDGFIDHINHNRSDNRISNLRVVDRSANGKNASISKTNSSGVIGVSWHNVCQKWAAHITDRQVQYHIGTFDKKEDAISARRLAEIEFGFHENHGKHVDELTDSVLSVRLFGLTYVKQKGKWYARSDSKHIGVFEDCFDAICALMSYRLNGSWRELVDNKPVRKEIGLPGIYLDRNSGTWRATYFNSKYMEKYKYIGSFDNLWDCMCAWKSFENHGCWFDIVSEREKAKRMNGLALRSESNTWRSKSGGVNIGSYSECWDAICSIKSYEAKGCAWKKVQDRNAVPKLPGLNKRSARKTWIARNKRKRISEHKEIWDAICSIKSYQAKACSYQKVHSQ